MVRKEVLVNIIASCFLVLHFNPSAAKPWKLMIQPAVGHIKPNGSITIMCRANVRLTDCQFKVGNGGVTSDMDFSEGKHSPAVIPKIGGKELFVAKYTGTGLADGQCGITLDRVEIGLYLIGCRAQADFGSRLQDFMSLAVDNFKPFKMQSKPRYKVVEPGSDVHLLCFTPNGKPLTQCSFKHPTIGWVVFHKGHMSKETSHYQYSGRGLEKGQCGMKLMNVTEADGGVYWCHGVAKGSQQYRAITLQVTNSRTTAELSVENAQLAVGDRLVAKCTVRGVFPLPAIAWYLGAELIRKDGIDDTPYAKTSYTWLWEMQSTSQELVAAVTADIANKVLKCIIVVDMELTNATFKLGVVKPSCGYRMLTKYDFNYGNEHEIKKREIHVAPAGKKNLATAGKGCRARNDCKPAPVKPDPVGESYEDETLFSNLEGDYEDFDVGVRISGGTLVITPAKPKPPQHVTGGKVVAEQQKFGLGEVSGPGGDSYLAFPWHVGLYRNLGKPDVYRLDCGGTLISRKHVVTAAHCVWDDNALKPKSALIYKIVLGKLFSAWAKQDGAVQRRDVAKINVNPNYRGRRNNFQADIALLEIAEAAELTSRVNVACVDWSGEFEELQLQPGSKGTVTGWGYTETEQTSEVLRYVDLPFMEPGECFEKVDDDMKRLITADKFCAGFTNGSTSVCQGDSGGGLVFNHTAFGAYYLRGVVSISFKPPGFLGNCYSEEVTGFTSISQSLKWMKSVVGMNS